LRSSEAVDRFSALRDAAAEGELRFDSPLQIDIRLRWVSGFVAASGVLRTSVRLSCSRCLGDFSLPLTIPFEATYSEQAQAPAPAGEEAEIELTADAIDQFPINGREIDLLEAIGEQVLLALPIRPLCREDCRGLCSRCGADLNQGACGCSEKPVDPRLAVLKSLKLNDR
jgi:uncharacterized protein